MDLIFEEIGFILELKYNIYSFQMYQSLTGMYGITETNDTITSSITISLDKTRLKLALTVQFDKIEVLSCDNFQFLNRQMVLDLWNIPKGIELVGNLLILLELIKRNWRVTVLMEVFQMLGDSIL